MRRWRLRSRCSRRPGRCCSRRLGVGTCAGGLGRLAFFCAPPRPADGVASARRCRALAGRWGSRDAEVAFLTRTGASNDVTRLRLRFPGLQRRFSRDQRSGGSLPNLKPGEILGAVALVACFTGCWGDVFGRGVWLLVFEPAVFVEPVLLAIVASPGPRRPETYHSFAGSAHSAPSAYSAHAVHLPR
jgi:hypothetical protein